MSNESDLPAFRTVYLLGGLQAVDFGEHTIDIGFDGITPLLKFKRPEYADLYTQLERRGLQPVGVQFFTDDSDATGHSPPRWCSWKTPQGLRAKQIIEAWSLARQSQIASNHNSDGNFSSKLCGYLQLTEFRLYQLAKAYHDMLRFEITGGESPSRATLFSNVWSFQVEAAIHGFLADAASLRDAIAEGLWTFVLGNTDGKVSSMSGLLKHAKMSTHPIVVEMIEAGAKNTGWIWNLSRIRDAAIHLAPVSARHEHQFSQIRVRPLLADKSIPSLHYPLTNAVWQFSEKRMRLRNYHDEAETHAYLEEQHSFIENSGDALEYAWQTLGKLMKLAEDLRVAARLHGERITLTDSDLVENPTLKS